MLIYLIILAVIQGITEFLPISSSGHLNFLSYFLPFPQVSQESLLLYFLILHAGTALAALYFFRKDIYTIIQGLWDGLFRRNTASAKDALKWVQLIVIISIPTGLTGLFFKSHLVAIGGNLLGLGLAWIGTAGVLFLTKKAPQGQKGLADFGIKEAFYVGLAQSLALIPGISRSGSTIAMALLLGATPLFAGKLSFLASFVAIFGALFLESLDCFRLGENPFSLFSLLVGLIVSFIMGLISLRFLIMLLNKGRLFIFSFYCLGLGIISCLMYFFNL